uniref:NADP-dependent oxidoreductase domain-containing protein n=2 Tax=Erythrolobus australicus TaxID=1077150 RepID=A0A7S1XIR3_9RHOD
MKENSELREHIVLATKVAGYSKSSNVPMRRTDPPGERDMPCRLDAESIRAAVKGSLRRLNTDYIDLYQLHWPDRYAPTFGSTVYDESKRRENAISFKETIGALKELIDEGKIRAWGLSNETTFGVCEAVRAADELGAPRPASIQNSYSLLHRSFETELAEACAPSHYNIGLLPWSILCGGALSGKYLPDSGVDTKASRHTMFPRFQPRFAEDRAVEATKGYVKVAKDAGMSPVTLATAFCCSRPFIAKNGSCIIGATTMDQLRESIDACAVELSKDTIEKINQVHLKCRDPITTL